MFSNDAFGQHFAVEELWADKADQCRLWEEAMKYYANILNPFSPLVKAKVEEIQKLNLPIDIIATSHGAIWRENPMQIVENTMNGLKRIKKTKSQLYTTRCGTAPRSWHIRLLKKLRNNPLIHVLRFSILVKPIK